MTYTKEDLIKRKEYYNKNKDKFHIYSKIYRNSHKDFIRELNKKYRNKNKDKVREIYRIWRLKNLDEIKRKQREYYYKVKKPNRIEENKRIRELRKKQREKIIQYYGAKCKCCGEEKIEFLTIDHINNDGAKHRKEIGGSSKILNWIIKNNFPKDFQILCFNCNLAKSIYGICPHKKLIVHLF